MTITITLTTAGTDTGPFNLFSDIDGYVSAFVTGVSKAALLAGYTTTLAPVGTTIVRVQSNSLCNNFIDITLTIPPPVSDCDCYLISSIQDPSFPLLGTTFFYTDCNDNFISVLIEPSQSDYVCSKVEPSYFPEGRGTVVLESNDDNCGGCSSTTTTTTTTSLSTTTTTTTVLTIAIDVYECGDCTGTFGIGIVAYDPSYVIGEFFGLSDGRVGQIISITNTLPITHFVTSGPYLDCASAQSAVCI